MLIWYTLVLTKALFLIVPHEDLAESPLVRAVLEHWPKPDRPQVRPVSFAQLLEDESVLSGSCAVWICCPGEASSDGALLEAGASVEELRIPGLVTLGGETRDLGALDGGGLVVGPPDTPPRMLCAVLRSIWAQSGVLDELRSENRLLRAHEGGLCAQMDSIDEELRLAAQLQREFLPTSLPSVNGMEFQILFRPAGYVSGDIYDVLRLDETHIGFFLADAVGHGVPAALMTMYIKRSLRTKEIRTGTRGGYRIIPPDEAIGKLNRDMCGHEAAAVRFATACYGIINCLTGEVEFARGGHPFPIILRADGGIDKLGPEGAMLGVFPEEVFELAHTRLAHGDRLLMFSDGFETAFPEAEEADDQDPGLANHHFEQEFLDLANGDPEAAIQRLQLKLDRQSGSLNQRDDITLLLLNVNPAANLALARDEVELTHAIAI